MTLVPEIRDQLHATAQRRVKSAGPARGPARRWRRLIGSLAIPASVLVVASVLAVVLLDVHHLTHGARQTAGQPAHVPPPGWGKLTVAANDRVHQQDTACRPQRLPGAAPLRHDAPGQDLDFRPRGVASTGARQPTGLRTGPASTSRGPDQRGWPRYLSPLRPPRPAQPHHLLLCPGSKR